MPRFEEPGEPPSTSEAEIIPLALARLERMIESRLSESLSFGLDIEPIVKVKVLEEAHRDDSKSSEMPMSALPSDPDFYEGLAGRILDTLEQLLEEGERLPGVPGEEPVVDLTDQIYDEKLGKLDLGSFGVTCDYLVARLRCLSCGHVGRDNTTHCETFVCANSDGREFRVGSEMEVELESIPPDFYLWCTPYDGSGPLRVVEGWECSSCHQVNWAEIVIRDGVVESIWSVEFNRDLLERVHLLSSESVEIAARLTDQPSWTLLADDVLQILLTHI